LFKPALVLVLASALLLASAQSAAGFGFITKWRIRGTPPIAAHGKAVYVAAANANSQWIQKYTTRGALVTQWRVPANHGKPMRVRGVATDGAGNLYALTVNHNRGESEILKYTDRGRLVDKWDVGMGFIARGIATDEAGNVYVTIADGNRVEKYSSTGRLLFRFEAAAPWQIATGADGAIYTVNPAGVSVYRDDGTFVRSWGSGAAGPEPGVGGLEVPTAVAVNRAGRVLVTDAGRNERDVKVFTPEGVYVGQIGGPGRGNGRFRFSPNYLAIDTRGDLYVVSLRTIQKFGEPSSAFSLGGVKLNRRAGTARLTASLAGVGKLNVEGEGIRHARRRASVAGEVWLPIVPNRATKSRLQRTGRATVEIQVTYTPTTAGNAHPATRSTRIALVKTH
jgi:hypothetical protein